MSEHEERPTIRTRIPLGVTDEVEVLKKAMKGLGTDEDAIIKVLTSCSSPQRQIILQQYKRTHARDLLKDLKKELSGNFEDVIVALMTPTPEYLAQELKRALKAKDAEAIAQIVFASEPHVLRAIRTAYRKQNDDSLEEDFDDETRGVFEDVLVATVLAQRDDTVSEEDSVRVAQALCNDDPGLVNQEVIRSFATLSFPQLKGVFQEYYKLAGRTLGQAFDLHYKGQEKENMQALFRCVENKHGYLAAALRKSMSGPGTKDRDLIRLIVSRCEVDLGNIKDEYFKMYERTLENDVKGDTSGDYKKILLALLQGN